MTRRLAARLLPHVLSRNVIRKPIEVGDPAGPEDADLQPATTEAPMHYFIASYILVNFFLPK